MWVHKGRQSLCLDSRTPAHLWMKRAVKWSVISVTIHLAVMEVCSVSIWCNTPILFWVAPYTGSHYGSHSFSGFPLPDAIIWTTKIERIPLRHIPNWTDAKSVSFPFNRLALWRHRRTFVSHFVTMRRQLGEWHREWQWRGANPILRLSCHGLNLSVLGAKTSFVMPVRFLYS